MRRIETRSLIGASLDWHGDVRTVQRFRRERTRVLQVQRVILSVSLRFGLVTSSAIVLPFLTFQPATGSSQSS